MLKRNVRRIAPLLSCICLMAGLLTGCMMSDRKTQESSEEEHEVTRDDLSSKIADREDKLSGLIDEAKALLKVIPEGYFKDSSVSDALNAAVLEADSVLNPNPAPVLWVRSEREARIENLERAYDALSAAIGEAETAVSLRAEEIREAEKQAEESAEKASDGKNSGDDPEESAESQNPDETPEETDADPDSSSESSSDNPAETPEESSENPASGGNEELPKEETPAGNQVFQVGGTVTFGRYEQDNNLDNGREPLTWKVLDVTAGGRALLLSVFSLQNIQFDETNDHAGWGESTLRSWLNYEFFLDAFTDAEAACLVPVSYVDTYSLKDTYSDTTDRVFCLSTDDVRRLLPEPQSRIAKNSDFAQSEMKRKMIGSWFYPDTEAEVRSTVAGWEAQFGENCSWWWLKDPAGGGVTAVGELRGSVDRRDLNSVRPAVWVDIEMVRKM